MAIKDEQCLINLFPICRAIKPEFLSCDDGTSQKKAFILDEESLFKAIDPKLIASWEQFEYLLCLVIENRIYILYQNHLNS